MPDEVVQNGEVSDPKDDETSDWTEVNTLKNNTKVKPYDIELLATSKVPHNIPYLEVYRTDELYYEPYTSPYLSMGAISGGAGGTGGGGGSDSGGGGGSSDGVLWTKLSEIMATYYPKATADYWIRQLRNAPNTWVGVASVVNKLGGDKGLQNNVIRAVLNAKKNYSANNPSDRSASGASSRGESIADVTFSSKDKVKKLHNELLNLVKKNYKTHDEKGHALHHSVIVNKYIASTNNRASVGSVTIVYNKYLKSGVNRTELNTKVMNIKAKYSK